MRTTTTMFHDDWRCWQAVCMRSWQLATRRFASCRRRAEEVRGGKETWHTVIMRSGPQKWGLGWMAASGNVLAVW